MNKFLFILASILLFILLAQVEETAIPQLVQPTDRVWIKEDMENGEHRDHKKIWFEAIHKCADSTDWRQIERQNTYNKYLTKLKSNQQQRRGGINIADGSLVGNWEEKGSINQAGSITKTVYNKLDQNIYAMSAGGSMWKSTIDGLNWEVVNQDLRFDQQFLDIVYPTENSYRIISSVGGVPYYMDQGDNRWNRAQGFSLQDGTQTKDQLIVQDGENVFYLAQADKNSLVTLMHSDDYGLNYKQVATLTQDSIPSAAIAVNPKGNQVYIINQVLQGSDIFIYNYNLNSLTLLSRASAIDFGKGNANLQVYGVAKFYAYDVNDNLKKTESNGLLWTTVSKLPITPWEVGLYVSPTDSSKMMIGGIEAFTSSDSGKTWDLVNSWTSYYRDIATNLHADIMHIIEFESPDNGPVTMVSNHGGISRSFNYGATFMNIGTKGLNISQYYSVKTYPEDNDYIFAGSQDQGLQRAKVLGEGPDVFDQFISGDYGYLQFTNNGKDLWAVFPGGWVTYFDDPINLVKTTKDFNLFLQDEITPVLPALISSPYEPNAVIAGGGGGVGLINSGSRLVSLVIDDLGGLFVSHLGNFDFSVNGGRISALGYNKVTPSEFYVLTTNGKFYKSTDSAQSFTEKPIGLPEEGNYLYGHFILTSELDAEKIVVGGSGYNNTPVHISYNGGESFEEMSEGLPQTTVFQMVYSTDEKFIFAATEAGPYVYIRGEKRWFDLAQGEAPNQRYWSVEFLEEKQLVRYGTFGRGIWDLQITNLETSTEDIAQLPNTELNIFPNPASDFINISNLPSNKGQLSIINARGQVMYRSIQSGPQGQRIDISHYANGIYYLIFDDNKNKSSSILVKS